MYCELHCKSNFSFLEGASHADELVERAIELGYSGLAITDRNSLAGVVRGYAAAKETNFPFIVGVELHPLDGPPVLVWPRDRAAYGQLCRLLTLGRTRANKGECILYWNDIAEHADGWLAGLCLRQPAPLSPNSSSILADPELGTDCRATKYLAGGHGIEPYRTFNVSPRPHTT